MFPADARPQIAAELEAEDENPLAGLYRRFEVVPGAQAKTRWPGRMLRPGDQRVLPVP